MSDETPDAETAARGEAVAHSRADGEDLIVSALDYLRGVQQTGGKSSGTPPLARQEEDLRQWAGGLGLTLDPALLIPRLERGGQEHDWFSHEERVFKVTRGGVFGLSPGIELALVSSDQDARRFHLWEASPIDYLERLHLQNQLVPGVVRLEGIIDQPGDLSIVTLIPFDVIPCRPTCGFLQFISDTLAAGHSVKAVRTVSTPH